MQAHEYASLLPYAQTEHQRRCIEAVVEHGSQRKAAKALGCNARNLEKAIGRVRREAALAGYSPEHDYNHPVPPGFNVKGVSTYYNREGKPTGQWVKSQQDKEAREVLLLEAVREVAEGLRGKCPKIKAPRKSATNAELLSLYVLGDPHLGLYTWHEEVGADFDLKIAERDLKAVVDELVRQAPASDSAILANLGDFFHADDNTGRTSRSGHDLDTDSRWAKVLAVGVKLMIHCTQRLLEKHRTVDVINLLGNHDDHSAVMLSVAMGMYFEGHPRVTVDQSPCQFRYREHGRVLLGFTHGHMRKWNDLPSIMATDQPEAWGRTRARYFHLGHIHSDTTGKDPTGCKLESHRTLAPADAWAFGSGYRSQRDAKVITYDHHGEWNRCTINLARVGLDPTA